MRKLLILAAACIPLTACTTATEVLKGPELAPVMYPAQLAPVEQAYRPDTTPASANSLWRVGARSFFGDQRARRVGDILTVNIDINDRAQTQNSTNRQRTTSASGGVSNFFGLENSIGKMFPSSFDAENLINTEGEFSANGSGNINRAERVNLTIAAVITAVMPNGNLVIQGRQEVRTNRELRELTVAGIVRPEDISSANTIQHTQIAEARISYGGRGDVSRMQNTPAAQALMERFSPF